MLSADLDKCQGYANCMVNAPDVFDLDDDGKVDILEPTPDPGEMDAVREAVSSCPVRALSLRDTP